MTLADGAAPVLDDRTRIRTLDAGGMLGFVAALGEQLRRGYEIARAAPSLPSGDHARLIVLCGMGGSGLAGDVVRSLYAARSPVPIVVSKGYALPEFCGHDTVVVAVSYSGNTEETLAVYGEAVERGCRIVAVSAGGALAARADADRVPHVPIPSDVSVPRAAVGYLAAAPIGVLDAAGLIPPAKDAVAAAAGTVEAMAERLSPERPSGENPAKDLAVWIGERTPLVWASEGLGEAAAVRWKNQVNENAKLPAFLATVPELDHNEIEGWSPGSGERYALVVLRHDGEDQRLGARFAATLRAIAPSGLDAREVRGEGGSALEQLFSLITMGDFVSVYLALRRGVDPTPVPVLTELKARLRG